MPRKPSPSSLSCAGLAAGICGERSANGRTFSDEPCRLSGRHGMVQGLRGILERLYQICCYDDLLTGSEVTSVLSTRDVST